MRRLLALPVLASLVLGLPSPAPAAHVLPGEEAAARLVSRTPDGRSGDGDSGASGLALGRDGRWAAFASEASDLVPGDDNEASDVFLRADGQPGLELVSAALDGSPGNGASSRPDASDDGRLVVFASFATDLVPDHGGTTGDVFLRDRRKGSTTCLSLGPTGRPGNASSSRPSISGDGRLVVFESHADDLVPGDDNGACDVFLHDRRTRRVRCLSRALDGSTGGRASHQPEISADGRCVVFASRAGDLVPGDGDRIEDVFEDVFEEVFVYDLAEDTLQRVGGDLASDASGGLFPEPSLSRDGRFVVWVSRASNLATLPGDDGPRPTTLYPALGEARAAQVLLLDRSTGAIELVSAGPSGAAAEAPCSCPSVSDDGALVLFQSAAGNLAAGADRVTELLFARDRRTGSTSLLRRPYAPGATEGPARLSGDGRRVLLTSRADDAGAGDGNGTADVYLLAL